MTEQALQELKDFDLETAEVFLWVFKRSSTVAKYSANYVRTDEALDEALRGFAHTERERITEWIPYGHLSQPTENGCLSVSIAETNFEALQGLVDRPEMEYAITELKRLKGSAGYLVKFVSDTKTLYALRRSPATWKTTYKKKGVVNTIFRNGELGAVEGVDFTIEPGFDLFAMDEALLVGNKRGFESMMQYRAGYVQAFGELQQMPEFVALFTDMAPLLEHVGQNGTHLRRMAVIQEKNFFADPNYLGALKAVCDKYQWGIGFDVGGRIVPTADTAAVIMKLLLDQRLVSEITQIMYDVPEGVPVN